MFAGLGWGDYLSLFISITALVLAWRAYRATSYPPIHTRLWIWGAGGLDNEKPPHKVVVEVKNLHVSVAIEYAHVSVDIGKQGTARNLWRIQWAAYTEFEPLSLIEPNADHILKSSPAGHNLEKFISQYWPDVLLKSVELQDTGVSAQGQDIPVRHVQYQMSQTLPQLRVRVTTRYLPAIANGSRYKHKDMWTIIPKAEPDAPLILHHWEVKWIERGRDHISEWFRERITEATRRTAQ